jgi:hypothetical protein
MEFIEFIKQMPFDIQLYKFEKIENHVKLTSRFCHPLMKLQTFIVKNDTFDEFYASMSEVPIVYRNYWPLLCLIFVFLGSLYAYLTI